jgi:hypothetical protein
MVHYDWHETARYLARQLGGPFLSGRGVVQLRLIDDSSHPARTLDDVPLVVAVFGNETYYADPRARDMVERLRRQLSEDTGQELGFAVSDDGSSWVMLVGADGRRYTTAAGRALQKLLLEGFLEDAVWSAWRGAYGFLAEGTSAAAPAGQPSGMMIG